MFMMVVVVVAVSIDRRHRLLEPMESFKNLEARKNWHKVKMKADISPLWRSSMIQE